MSFSVFAIANAFIELSQRDNEPITNMKLQKLVYITQGYALALVKRPLFDDDIRALKWGPVIMSLYDKVKHYGNQPIDKPIPVPPGTPVIDIDDKDSIESILVNFVWKRYKKYTAAQLSSITHQDGTPWKAAYSDDQFAVIPNDLIAEHYKQLIHKKAA